MNKLSHFPKLVLVFLLLTMTMQLNAQVVLKAVPLNVSVACDAVPLAAQVAASSNCLPVDIQLVETISNKTCSGNYTLHRTWTATDNCGQKSTATQVLVVTDTKGPVIKLIDPLLLNFKNGDTLTMNCFNTPSFNATSATATDACDANPKLIFKDNLVTNGNCLKDKFIVIMSCSWIATDDCGNKTELQGYFKVVDNEAPLMTGVPKDVTVDCDKIPDPALNPPVPVDKCDKFVKMIFTEVKIPGTCDNRYQLKRLWTATDQCGNSAAASQLITVQDKTAPVISNAPKDITVDLSLGQTIPPAATLTVKDNCALTPKIVFDEKTVDNGCDKFINRFWTVSDGCGNIATHTQSILVLQKISPISGLSAVSDSVCFVKDSVMIGLKIPILNLPQGFKIAYFLVNNTNIIGQNSTAQFPIFNAGIYTIHSLTYNPNQNISFSNVLKINDLNNLLIGKCTTFDTKGIKINVTNCYNEGCVLPTLSKVLIADASCGQQDGYMVLEVGTNSNAYTYKWTPDVSQANAAVGLGSGVYSIKIQSKTDTACQITKVFMVGTADGPQPKGIKTTAANCNAADGSAAINGIATWKYIWPDGKNLISRTDLKAGVYAVTISDPSLPNCDNIIGITIGQNNGLQLSYTIDKKADCLAANGKVSVAVSGGSGQYTYSWGATASQSNLAAGAYSVTINDVVNGCQSSIHFVVENNVSSANIKLTTKDFMLKCAGDTTGVVAYTVQIDSTKFVGTPLIKIIDTKNKLFINGKLSAGKYCIVVYDGNKCIAGSACFEITQPEPLIVHVTSINGACDGGTISVIADGGTQPYSYVWADLPNQTDVTNRTTLANGVYKVKVSDANQCNWDIIFLIKNNCTKVKKDTIYLSVLVNKSDSTCVPLELNFDASKTKYNLLTSQISSLYGTWSLNAKGCLKYNAGSIAKKYVDVIGVVANENKLQDTTCIIVSIVDKNNTDCNIFKDSSLTLTAKDCLSQVELCVNIPLDDISKYSIDDNGTLLSGVLQGCKPDTSYFYSLQNIPDKGLIGPYELKQWSVNGKIFSSNFQDLNALIVLLNQWDPTGKWSVDVAKGTIVNHGIMQNYGELVVAQLNTGSSSTSVISTATFFNSTLLNFSPGKHNIYVYNKFLGCGDSLFLQVNCDTCTSQIIDFKPIKTKNCNGLTDLCVGTDFVNVANYNILDNGKPYTNGLDSCTGGFTRVRLAVGAHDVKFVNKKTGCEEKTYGVLIVCDTTVIKHVIDTIVDIVMIKTTDSTCLNVTNTIGTADTIFNYCPQSSGNYIKFGIKQGSTCVTYTGLKVGGPDYACIVVCNKSGKCDTTIFKVTCVKDTSTDNIALKIPVAYKDIDTTMMNTAISLDVVKNDSLKGLSLQELIILTQPKNGTVTKDIDKLKYQPNFDFCGETEMFQYSIRTAEGRDTGTVCIFVKCGTFKIYNGFSPNKDGTNEHFHIEGIELFPDNEVTIFNRWGNMVYNRSRYTNDEGWKGENTLGKDVPDGTYWYCVDLKNSKKYFGWVMLQR